MIRIFNHYLHRQTLSRALFDMGFVLLAMVVALATFGSGIGELMPAAGTQMVTLAAGMFVINSASGFYQSSLTLTPAQAWARASLALTLALPLTYGLFSLLPDVVHNRGAVTLVAMAGVAAVIVRRVYVAQSATGKRTRSRVLIYGAGAAAADVGTTLRRADPTVEIVGYYPGNNEKEALVPEAEVLPTDRPLKATAEHLRADEIIVALTERRAGSMPMRDLLDCKIFGIKVYDLATHFETTLGQIRVNYANAGWLIFGDGFNQGLLRTSVKRGFDIACSLVLLVLGAPVMLLTALAIRIDSRGPALYRQDRVGANGRVFSIAKFRSMRADAESDGKPRWAAAGDDRITRVGRWIRLLRIDEMPQLFNVLRGDMSLVGPRPERPFFVDQLTREVPYFAVRHSVKPGVTGWAQVRYCYGSTVQDAVEKLQFDLYYVKNHSLLLDVLILFETVAVVLTGKGAR